MENVVEGQSHFDVWDAEQALSEQTTSGVFRGP